MQAKIGQIRKVETSYKCNLTSSSQKKAVDDMQVSSSRYTMRIPSSSQSASILSDVGPMQGDNSKNKTPANGAAVGNSNSLNSSSASLRASLAASALDKAATGTSFRYSGPNLAAVTATNDRAIACGLSGGYDLNEILTDEDKALVGYEPNSREYPNAAYALADARYSGRLTGGVTSDFLSALQNYYDMPDGVIQNLQSRLSAVTQS